MIALLLAGLAIVAMAAGCGGDGDSTSGADTANRSTVTTSSLGKDEFIEQASRACQQARKNLLERVLVYTQQHESDGQGRSAESETFAGSIKAVLLPTIRKEMAEIRRLGAPAGDEGEVEAFLAAEQEAVDSVARIKRVVSGFQFERYFAKSAKLFREYGLAGCANGEEV
jgi:hypothetical protein